jgi:HlyD family secretion protein
MKKIIILAILAGVCGWFGFSYFRSRGNGQMTYRFVEVTKGRLVATVGATGTLQPREVVDVGAQVVGPIIKIGEDLNQQSKIIDWGSIVKGPTYDSAGKIIEKGTTLALIDPELYEAAVQSADATVKSAQASVLSAQASVKSAKAAALSAKADLDQKKAVFVQAGRDWDRAQKLYPTNGIAKAEYDLYQANYKTAEANVANSQANVEKTEADIRTAEAVVQVNQANVRTAQGNLRTAMKNLDYTKITSPVTGVVIDRRVNVGQTVVASLSAPSLFLLAKDLSRMEVWATVNEVDIGKIKIGQDVKFTVDAHPGRVYRGKVVPQGKLAKRLNATMNQNVVTYTAVVSVDNSDMTLDPYLTTNLTFIVEDKKNALLVPNAALRWQPSSKQIAPEQREAYGKLRGKKRSATDGEQEHGFVWIQGEDGYAHYIQVRTGVSDTVNTEVLEVLDGAELVPDETRLIVAEAKSGEQGSSNSNPFVAQPFAPKKKD